MLISVHPVLEKLQKHMKDNGLQTSIVEKKLDFEFDFLDSNTLGTTKGTGNVGTLRVYDSPIDYINIVTKQEYAKCNFAMGGFAGMGVHLHSWWKIRFFMTFPEYIKLGPFDIGTISTIKKGLIRSELENYFWSGYHKLTTLPPGLIRDNVVDALDSDQLLRKLMTKNLLKERTILVSRYSPSQVDRGLPTNSKIVITTNWKYQKDLFIDGSTIKMYEKIAKNVKKIVNDLKYHLRE